MKQLITKASTAMILSQLWVMKALANNTAGNTNGGLLPPPCGGGINCDNSTDPVSIRATIFHYVTVVLDFITLIGVIYVIIAGIRLIVSGGDEGEKDAAKKTIIYVVVGILVIIFARVIVTFVASLGNA